MPHRQRCAGACLAICATVLAAAPAAAQGNANELRFEIRGTLGLGWIADVLESREPPEAVFNQPATGVAGRVYPWGHERGFAFEFEYLNITETDIEDNHTFLGGFVWEASRVLARPYLIVSAGLMRHQQRISAGGSEGVQTLTDNLLSLGVGGGLHIHLNDRWVITPEVGGGQNPRFWATVAIGFEFG